MMADMDSKIVDNLVVFLQRVNLQASEIPAYIEVMTAVQELKSSNEEQPDGND